MVLRKQKRFLVLSSFAWVLLSHWLPSYGKISANSIGALASGPGAWTGVKQQTRWSSAVFNSRNWHTYIAQQKQSAWSIKYLLYPGALDDAGLLLELCDCVYGSAPPGALGCGLEGFFVAGFEREGTWVRCQHSV